MNLSIAQMKRGHEVTILARRKPGEPKKESVSGIDIYRLSPPYSFSSFLMASRMKTWDSVIHTHATSGFALSLLKGVAGFRLLSHVHGTTFSSATPLRLKFGSVELGYSRLGVISSYLRERMLWRSADLVAAVSSSVKKDLVERYGVEESRIRTVYNGVDPNLFRRHKNSEVALKGIEGRKVVLYVGHFGLRKGLTYLIRAMKRVREEVPDSLLLCIGGVPSWLGSINMWGYLTSLIEKLELKENVILLDRVDNRLLPNYYSVADVFVLPSYYEAFPKVLIEAMACELPVITSRMGGVVDSVADGVNGYLVEYGNVKQIGDALITLLMDREKARDMGRKGREIVLRNFTWERVAERIDSAYEELFDGS